MIEFEVKDMTDAECAKTITRVIKETAPAASVEVDLPSHLVRIDGVSGPDKIERAIREVGYTPKLNQ
ncbi:MAG TPA: heavy-metal-associated domain-containing protein [Candidimonas sp.]|nr:heavy-metal-associated domain-containing protein [Candidimonas sp.]